MTGKLETVVYSQCMDCMCIHTLFSLSVRQLAPSIDSQLHCIRQSHHCTLVSHLSTQPGHPSWVGSCYRASYESQKSDS